MKPQTTLLLPYIALVVVLAGTLSLLVVLAVPAGALSGDQVLQAAILGLMIAGARNFPIHLSPASKIFVDTAAIFAAILLLPAPWALATAGGGILVGEAMRRGHPLQFVFGVAETVVEVAAAAMIYYLLQADGVGSGTAAEINLLAIGLAAVAVYALNVVLVDTIIALTIGFGSLRWSVSRHRVDLPQQVALYFLGLFAALTAYHYPLTLAFLAIPASVVYISLRDGQFLRRGAQETLESLADIVDLRDHYTFEHSTRVANLARAVAGEMKLNPDQIEAVYTGARIHDVGKIGIKGEVLLKEGPLSDDDWREMKTHPELGATLVSKFPDYISAAQYVLAHHERFDGRGYPNKLKGKDIPLGARIISVADCFDAMTSKRPYRSALDIAVTIAEIRRNAGKQFDPECVAALINVLNRQGLLPASEQSLAVPMLQPELAT
ncbi:MAG: HD domain-containing phosphohydrolase [Dehalococcoidia bacterium]